jgi:hypothetical protein
MGVGIGSGNALHSFTPVRRREPLVNTRQSQVELGAEWTAMRCHRLLRPLTSRVAILKKEPTRFPSTIHVSNRRTQNDLEDQKARNSQDLEDGQASETDWSRARKRVRRTYSRRCREKGIRSYGVSGRARMHPSSKDTRLSVPGEISVPTPILNRARGYLSCQTQDSTNIDANDLEQQTRKTKRPKPSYLTKDCGHFQLSETLRRIRKTTAATRYTIYEGIYNGLKALLKATMPENPGRNRKGARSLLSICLRTVPHYIAEEEIFLSVHADETRNKLAIEARNISAEIYNGLETIGPSARGWKRLGTVARAHGVQVISDAIRAGLFDVQYSSALVMLCVHMASPDDAEVLLSSLLTVGHFPGPKTLHSRFSDDAATSGLCMLQEFVKYTGRSSFYYRQLSKMVSERVLPVSWLATKEFGQVWTGVIQSLSYDSRNVDAIIFIMTLLPQLWWSSSLGVDERGNPIETGDDLAKALRQTFSSVLTTLSAMVILSKEAAGRAETEGFESSVPEHEHIITLLRTCLIENKLFPPTPTSNEDILLLMSNLVVGSGNTSRVSFHPTLNLIDSLLDHLRQMGGKSVGISSAYNDLVMFVCSVARCCGRGASSSGLEHLEHLHHLLEDAFGSKASSESNVLYEVIVDSAFEFSRQAPSRKHLAYAERIEAKFHHSEHNKPMRSPISGSAYHPVSVGFRWEEGIREWVTATPAVNINRSKVISDYTSMDESECDTPFRPVMIRRQLNETALPVVGARILRRRPSNSKFCRDTSKNREVVSLLPSSDDVSFGGSATSCRSSAESSSGRHFKNGRGLINKVPMLGQRVCQASQDWQRFDDSDDELNSHLVVFHDGTSLPNVMNMAHSRTRRLRQTNSPATQYKSLGDSGASLLGDSEDELGI